LPGLPLPIQVIDRYVCIAFPGGEIAVANVGFLDDRHRGGRQPARNALCSGILGNLMAWRLTADTSWRTHRVLGHCPYLVAPLVSNAGRSQVGQYFEIGIPLCVSLSVL
jgi:hypothetical protein